MNALILGGCGSVGTSIARDLIKSEDVRKVTLGDINIDIEGVHESMRDSQKVTTQGIDAGNFNELVDTIKKNDVIINCIGPFYKYGIQTMRAAIEAKVNYLDICDDWDGTKEAFENPDLDKDAKKAGISLCMGFGSSPGTTNVIAKYAADKLDEVDTIRILWLGALNDSLMTSGGIAAWMHGFHMFSGHIPEFIDGNWVDVPAGSGAEEVEFLGEPEKCEIYYVGHPEPVTLPRYIKGVKTVENKGGWRPLWANKMFMEFDKFGLTTETPIEMGGVSVNPLEVYSKVFRNSPVFQKLIQQSKLSPGNVVVKGNKGNKLITYEYKFTGTMVPGTAIPASIFAQMLYAKEITAKGLVAPEGAIEPMTFFKRFAQKGLVLTETMTVTQDMKF